MGRRRLVSIAALALGAVLFAGSLFYIDIHMAIATGRRLGRAIPLALFASGLWHLTRTWAWSWCFPRPRAVRFSTLLRVRLAAEAFSYLTISGVAGEPLKVVLLGDRVPARDAAAAVALERIAYIIGTTLVVGLGSLIAIADLPLSPLWFRIFRGFAIGSGALGAALALMLYRRDSYLMAGFRAADRAAGTNIGAGRAGRFVTDVGRQVADLVRGNGPRLIVLTAASLVAYACMSAEAWLILRAVGVPITFVDALAIETFTRVVSFATAFIPANIGALEASNLAAVAAVGAAGAGAPLALARRLRGLFWAAVGLAIYPRGHKPSLDPQAEPAAPAQETPGPILLYLPSDSAVQVSAFTRIAGLPIAERVLRSAGRAGYARVLVFADAAIAPALQRLSRTLPGDIQIASSAEAWSDLVSALPAGTVVTAIGAGTVVSPALLKDAAALPWGLTPYAVPPGSDPGCGITHLRQVPAGPDYARSGVVRVRADEARDPALLAAVVRQWITVPAELPSGEDVSAGRARLVLRVAAPGEVDLAERTIRRSSYKDTDNTLARLNREVSLPISVALIRTSLTANQLSVALVAVGFYSAWLFSLGHYWTGVLGAFLSLAASVLDGCDGEIARLKYQESALGCWIETFGDYSYYLAIFVGLSIGAVRRTGWPVFYWFGAVTLAGTLLSFAFLIYLRSRITAGHPDKLHSIARERFQAEPTWWSRIIWRLSFVATRSAMPYGIMALSLAGALPLVTVLAAIGANVYWICVVLKLRHFLAADDAEAATA